MRLTLLALVALPSIALAAPKTGGAGKPSAPACGVTILPLVQGNVWTYNAVSMPTDLPPADLVRLAPMVPKAFTVTVKAVESKAGDTVVTLEEKFNYDLTRDPKKPVLDERTVTSTITCNAKKFDISPESFFFAGEPGGVIGIEIDKFERTGTSWQIIKGGFGENEWPEDLVVHWKRTPFEKSNAKLGGGKLELERRFTPGEAENITTKGGIYKAEPVEVKTTGRVTLDKPVSAELKPMELPADWKNQLWFVPGTGVVQTLNRFAHRYQLVNAELK